MSKVFQKNFKLIITVVSAILLFIILIVLYLTGFIKFIESDVQITIKDTNNFPIDKVEICFAESICSLTDNQGKAYFGIKSGLYRLTGQQDGFAKLDRNHYVSPFDDEIEITLQKQSTITKEIEFEQEYNFDNMRFISNDRTFPYTVDTNIVKIYQLTENYSTFSITTEYYEDTKLELDSSNNESIKLQQTADQIIKAYDWLNGERIMNFAASINDITYSTNSGELSITDLPIKQDILLTISSDNFNQQQSNLHFEKNGRHEDLDITLSQKGKIYFVSSKNGKQSIYESNIDGSSEMIISDNQSDNSSICMNENQIYYLSNQDNISTQFGFNIPLLYLYNSIDQNTSKVSKTNYEFYENIGHFNCKSMLRAFEKDNNIYFSNIDGQNINEIASNIEGDILEYKVSDTGDSIVYTLRNQNYFMFEINLSTQSIERIYESSNEIFIKNYKESSNLYLINKNNNGYNLIHINGNLNTNLTSLNSNTSHIININEKIYLIDIINGTKELFEYDKVNQTKTPISTPGDVDWLSNTFSDKYISFGIENNLYILDLESQKYKKVTENIDNPHLFENYFYL